MMRSSVFTSRGSKVCFSLSKDLKTVSLRNVAGRLIHAPLTGELPAAMQMDRDLCMRIALIKETL